MAPTTESLINDTFQAYLQETATTKPEVLKTHYGYLYAANERIADELMTVVRPYITSEVHVLQHKSLVSFSSKNHRSLKYVIALIGDIISRSDQLLIKDVKTGWLTEFLNNKELFGSEVLLTHAGCACYNMDDVISLYKTKRKERHGRSTYLTNVAQLNKDVMKQDYDSEFQHIIDYILSACHGHNETEIINALLNIKTILINDLKEQSPYFIKSSAAADERRAVYEYVQSKAPDNTKNMAWISFDPSVNGFNIVDIHEYWQTMGATVSGMLLSTLPLLKVNYLDELLEDEDKVIPNPPEFRGLDLDTGRIFGFGVRVCPRNIRYDVQEQGHSWRDVLSGAIVAHYHMFIEAKQNESVREQVTAFSDTLVGNPGANLSDKIVEIYRNAQQITQ